MLVFQDLIRLCYIKKTHTYFYNFTNRFSSTDLNRSPRDPQDDWATNICYNSVPFSLQFSMRQELRPPYIYLITLQFVKNYTCICGNAHPPLPHKLAQRWSTGFFFFFCSQEQVSRWTQLLNSIEIRLVMKQTTVNFPELLET